MEVEYIARRLGRFLGGVVAERALVERDSAEAVRRLLGIEAEEPDLRPLECARLRALAEGYRREYVALRELYLQLKRSLPAPDLAVLARRAREAAGRARLYRRMYVECSEQVGSHQPSGPGTQSPASPGARVYVPSSHDFR